ncbi:MAG: aldo/keto reductase [Actinomycetota bacterium]
MTAKLGFGCVNLGSAASELSWSAQIRLIGDAIDRGITVFDTADAYGSGVSEILLGKAIAGRRDQVTISTKGGYLFRPRSPIEQRARRLAGRGLTQARQLADRLTSSSADDEADHGGAPAPSNAGGGYTAQDFSPTHLRNAVHASLQRLGTDHIDIYQLHGPNEVHDDLLAELDDLRTAGTIGAFGIGAESLADAEAWLAVEQVGQIFLAFGLLDPYAASSVLPQARATGRKVWIRGVLGGGVLAAAMRDPNEVADHAKHQAITELVAIAADAGLGLDQLAIGWAIRPDEVDAVVLGMSSPRHLTRNLDLFAQPPLDDDLIARIDDCLARTLEPDPS